MTRGPTPANWPWRSARPRPGRDDKPPVPLDAAILFARSATWCCPPSKLSTAAAHSRSPASTSATSPTLNYQRHLFQERQIRSVSANTRADAREFLDFAGRHHIAVTTPRYPLSRADHALADLAAGRIAGAAVLTVD